MIILGVVLLILGLIFDVGILWTIGIILIVVGALLYYSERPDGPSAAVATGGNPFGRVIPSRT